MKYLIWIGLFLGCSAKETVQQKAASAVKKYILQNANHSSSYKPITFGKTDSTYITDSARYYELAYTRKNIVSQYNAANNLHLARKTDSLKTELLKINNEIDAGKTFTGLKIYHLYEGKNTLGEMVMNKGCFYLDSGFVVREFVLAADSVEREKNSDIIF